MGVNFRELSISDASKKMAEWKEFPETYLDSYLEKEYYDIRDALIKQFEEIGKENKYLLDIKFGLALYEILRREGFTARDAANDNIWRYLSLCVIPDLVSVRWGRGAEIRYYKVSNRIWLKTIWWYVYLGWQGTLEDTYSVLKNNNTDTIMQLVDRSGKKGYYRDTCRKILYYLNVVKRKGSSFDNDDFRKVMILHTALSMNIEPSLYEGGDDGYVKMLYKKVGYDIGDK